MRTEDAIHTGGGPFAAVVRNPFACACRLLAATALILLESLTPARAQQPAETAVPPEAPLFAEDEPLELTISLDFDAVLTDRAEERDYRPASLYVAGADMGHSISIKTRGYYRLHYLDCDIPPLRLNFRKSEVEGTVFEGQDKLKLVTHCQNGSDRFQQYVFQEYLIYRAYNLLTQPSFLTRLVHIRYVDATGRREPVSGYGFLIEDDDRMAERNGATIIGTGVKIHPGALRADIMTLLSVFQYMIGNTDWTISTYHNIRLVFDDSTRTITAVPYDFDWSGLISAPYATPFPELKIRSVRERRFMGPCRTEEQFAAVLDRFSQVEAPILALFRDFEYLDDRYRERSVDYLNEFFESARTMKKPLRDFERTCM